MVDCRQGDAGCLAHPPGSVASQSPALPCLQGSGGSLDSHPPDQAVEVLGEADALQALEAVSMGEEQDTETAHPQPVRQPSGNKLKKPPRAGAGEALNHSSGAAKAAADSLGTAKGRKPGRPAKAPKTPALMGQKRSAEK